MGACHGQKEPAADEERRHAARIRDGAWAVVMTLAAGC
jgi:hypothetical protein